MRLRHRIAPVAAVLLAGLAVAPGALAAERVVDRGVVQSASTDRIVLRALDGSSVDVRLSARTQIFVNGAPAAIASIEPGYVAVVIHFGSRPARVVRAFGGVPTALGRGTIATVGPNRIVIAREAGGTASVELTTRTTIRVGAQPAGRAALRPGRVVDVLLRKDGSAKLVIIRRFAH